MSTSTKGKADISDILQVPEPTKNFFSEVKYFNFFTFGFCLLGCHMLTCGVSSLLCFGLRLINLHGKLYNVLALCCLQYIQMYHSLLT